MKKAGIYKIYSKIKPDRIYIGSSIYIRKRWTQHRVDLKKGTHASKKLQRHYNKYGLDDLVFEIIVCCDQDNLTGMEQFYLETYRPYFNSALFAEKPPMLGRKHSEESRKKMKEAVRPKITEEAKIKISLALKGMSKKRVSIISKKKIYTRRKNNTHVTQETKNKISLSLLGHNPTYMGKKHTAETKKKISASLTGKHQSEDTIIKMRISSKNRENSGRFKPGQKFSMEHLKNIRKASFRSCKNKTSKYRGVIRLTLKNGEYRYRSIIKYEGKSIYLGTFTNELEAAIEYNKKSIEFYGDDMGINFKDNENEKNIAA